jgi:hypothetical protein
MGASGFAGAASRPVGTTRYVLRSRVMLRPPISLVALRGSMTPALVGVNARR